MSFVTCWTGLVLDWLLQNDLEWGNHYLLNEWPGNYRATWIQTSYAILPYRYLDLMFFLTKLYNFFVMLKQKCPMLWFISTLLQRYVKLSIVKCIHMPCCLVLLHVYQAMQIDFIKPANAVFSDCMITENTLNYSPLNMRMHTYSCTIQCILAE